MCMEKSSTIIFLLPLLALGLLTGATDATGLHYITKTCMVAAHLQRSIDVDHCIEALKDIPGADTGDAKGLLATTTKLAIQDAARTLATVEKMRNISCSPLLKRQLGYCLEAYKQTTAALTDSAAACSAGRFDELAKHLAVSGGVNFCQSALRYSGHGDLLSSENSNLHQLILICKTMADIVVSKNAGGSSYLEGSVASGAIFVPGAGH